MDFWAVGMARNCSHGLETLRYHTHEIFAILVMPRRKVHPEISGYTVTMAPYEHLVHSLLLLRFIVNI